MKRAPMLATTLGHLARAVGLTGAQQRTLDAITALMRRNGYPPTSRELAAEMGLTRTGVLVHLEALVRKGRIQQHRTEDGRAIARTMTIVGEVAR